MTGKRLAWLLVILVCGLCIISGTLYASDKDKNGDGDDCDEEIGEISTSGDCDSDPPPPPPDEKIASGLPPIAAAVKKEETAYTTWGNEITEVQGTGVTNALNTADTNINNGGTAGAGAQETATKTGQENVDNNIGKTAEQDGPQGGDPVLITSGEYRFEETDLEVPGILEAVGIGRHYTSENPVTGSYGAGWISSLDTRILRGTELQWRPLEQEYKRVYVDVIRSELNRAITSFKGAWGTGERWLETEGIYRGRLTAVLALLPGAIAAKTRIDNFYDYITEYARTHSGSSSRMGEVTAAKTRANTLLTRIRGQIANYEKAVGEIPEQLRRIEGIEARLAAAEAVWAGYRREAEKSDRIMGENAAVLYEGTPEYYYSTGFGTLNVIDEQGVVRLYTSVDGATWRPEKQADQASYIEEDGKGGYIVYGKGGRKTYYNSGGQYVGEADRAGNRVSVERDGAGKATGIVDTHGNRWEIRYSGSVITKVSGPEGQEAAYGYSGGKLTTVTDADGDEARYTYEGGRLKRIVKPDGSYIELIYGAEGPGGKKLVTETRHEEGERERFDYYSGRTIYTNHSGVKTTYWYDEKHRTTRELHDDGRDVSYGYNALGQLETESINGETRRYRYDTRGNIAEKSYSDGTRESRTWNTKDQPVRYVDRDGVVTEWVYDGKGNCLRMTQGGIVVFTGTYNGKGQLISGKAGNRAAETYTYDSRGYLASRSMTAGGATIMERWTNDALGRVTRYEDGAGREWRYSYGKHVRSETSPLGLETTWTYNNRKDLVRVSEKDLRTGVIREQSISYDKRHLPVLVKDGAGNETRYEYRGDGEVTKQKQGPWEWEYGYEAGGRVASVTRRKAGEAGSYTESYGYRKEGYGEETRKVQRPKAGGGIEETVYRYDAWGRVKQVVNALGEASTRTVSGAGRLKEEQGASGGYYAYSYDGAGRLIGAGRSGDRAAQAAYNADGSVSTRTDRNGEVTRYEYDGRGLMVKEISGAGEKRYQYDGAGRMVRQDTVTAGSTGTGSYYTEWRYNDSARTVTESEGGLYSTTWYLNGWGETEKAVNGAGDERSWSYNGAGQVVSALDGYGKETKYRWNEIGKIAEVTYPDNSVERYSYNNIGEVTKIEDAAGERWAGEYDEAGRLKKETGRPGINREYRYDAVGRIVEVKNGGEVTERYTYTNRGRTVTYTDGKGSAYVYGKNEYGELTAERNRTGDEQRYQYDKEGRQISRTAYSGKQVLTEYQDRAGKTITGYSDGSTVEIERDLAGNITAMRGETGEIRYRYDAGGMLVYQYDEGAQEAAEYGYDGAGRRNRMRSGNRDVQYWYGKNGELLKVADNSQRLFVEYEYDDMGRETKRTYGNGVKQETGYDEVGRTVMIKETDVRGNITRAEGYVYDGEGRRSHSVDEAGQITKYEYDSQSRLGAVLYPWTAEKAEADREEAAEAGLYFTPDKGQGERYSFRSDELSRVREALNRVSVNRGSLVSANQLVWRESYTYDGNGNRASKSTPWGSIRYEYDAENRMVKRGDVVLEYDRDGNMVGEKGLRYEARYEYNGVDRMTYSEVRKAGAGTVISRYGYDGYGRRTMEQDAGGEVMRTLYDGFGFEEIRRGVTIMDGSFTTRYAAGIVRPVEKRDEGMRYRWLGDTNGGIRNGGEERETAAARYTGIQAALYARGEAVGLNRTASTGTRGGSVYLGKDILGSVRSSSNEYGVLEDRYEYDAFGKPYKGDLSQGMNLGYTGKPYDEVTGLYNYGYRDYKPEAARFTTVDPIRDGNNWFAYVNNDPVNFVDLWGLDASDKDAKTPIVILGEREKQNLAAGIPITPIQEGLYTVTDGYGPRTPVVINGRVGSDFHNGIDMAANTGTPVRSIMDGEVKTISYDDPIYGNNMVIIHNENFQTFYAHLDSIDVEQNDKVVGGQVVGKVGTTGFSTNPHLHFEYQNSNGESINPHY